MSAAAAFAVGWGCGMLGMVVLAAFNAQFLWKHHRLVVEKKLCGKCDWCQEFGPDKEE